MSRFGQGLSAAGYAAGEMFAKSALLDAQGERETERAMRLAEFKDALEAKGEQRKVALVDQARVAQTARIDAKASEMADEQIAPKNGLIDAGITDRSAWTPEQQAAVDQSLAMDKKGLKGKLRTEAAIATGDISPKDAAAVEYKNEAMVYKAMLEQAREEGKDRRLELTLEQRQRDSETRMEMLLKRLANSDTAKSEKAMIGQMLSVIENTRKDITSEATNLRQLYQAQIKDKSRAEVAKVDAEYKPKFDAVDERRKANDLDLKWARERVGMPKLEAAPPPAPKPAPGAAPKPGAPSTRPPLSSFDRKS